VIWSNWDLVSRLTSSLLPPRLGYRLARGRRPSGAKAIEERVATEVERVLGDRALGMRAGERFLGSLACDDLDALTAASWPRGMRRRSFSIEGMVNLPAREPAIFASFHLGGGFRVFDALLEHGLRPAFLRQPFGGSPSAYVRAIEAARGRYFQRYLGDRLIAVGPGARRRLEDHLATGGVVVALLDVAPASLGLRDRAQVSFLGREIELAVGLMRLAGAMQIPVVPYDGRVVEDRRVLTFHPPHRGVDPESLLRSTIATLEGVVRERPWDWQGWLDLEQFFSAARTQ
jgi:lauroyl/myristoyl acyltransferase